MSQKQTAHPDESESSLPILRIAGGLLGLLIVAIGIRLATTPRIDSTSIRDSRIPLLIDVNSATELELGVLPRIGPALARRIVEDRTVSGPFRSIDDLDRVPGIGPRTIEAIREYTVAR